MINSLVNLFFGCAHNRTTFPLTPARNSRTSNRTRNGTYIVCLDCGKEFDYNWHEMRVGSPIRQSPAPLVDVQQEQPVA